jgi:hypothetical protein
MTDSSVPGQIILYPFVYRLKDTVLSDPVQQSAAPEHLPHRILQLGKQDLGISLQERWLRLR